MFDNEEVVEPLSHDEGRPSVASDAEVAKDPSKALANHADPVELRDESPEPNRDLEALTGFVRGAEVPDELMRGAIEYAQNGTHTPDELAAFDADHSQAGAAELRSLWQGDFDKNLRLIDTFLDERLPPHIAQGVRDARLADGRAAFNDPAVLQRVLGLAKKSGTKVNPSNPAETIESIDRLMREGRKGLQRRREFAGPIRALLSAR